jgi:hypothetical protein
LAGSDVASATSRGDEIKLDPNTLSLLSAACVVRGGREWRRTWEGNREEAGSRRAAYRYLGICVLRMLISKSNLLMVAFLLVILLEPTRARKPTTAVHKA